MKNIRKYLLIGTSILLLLFVTGCGTNNSGDNVANITEARAKEIALGQVPGATAENIVEWDRDNDRGVVQYDCEIVFQNQRYDFEIDATDGSILGWSVEPVRD